MTTPAAAAPAAPISVLFVCLGNICRSTMAEGVFRSLVAAPSPYAPNVGRVDSAGTGAYHLGSEPDERTLGTLQRKGVRGYEHAARKVCREDFEKFDYVFAMDCENLRNLERIRPAGAKAKVELWGAWADVEGKGKEVVEDPYYGGQRGFETAYEQCVRFSGNFLKGVFPDVA